MHAEAKTGTLSHERLHQLQRLLPQSLLLLLIIRIGSVAGLIRRGIVVDYARNLAFLKVFSTLNLQSLRSSCPDGGRSTLLRALARLADVGVFVPRLHHVLVDMCHETSEDESGMNRPCVYTLASVPTVEFGCAINVGCLALSLSHPRVVLSHEVEVIQVDAAHAMAGRRKHNNPRLEVWSARLDQSGKKKLDQQEVSEVVCAELRFEAICCASFRTCHYTCVGNEDVEAIMLG